MNTATLTGKLALSAALLLALASCSKNDHGKTDRESEFVTKVRPPRADGTVGMLLPDFTELVAREGATVVNIQAVNDGSGAEAAQEGGSGENDPFAEFFKRLVPNQPDMPDQEDGSEANFGSGVIISADGYILTNTHVVRGLNSIKVILNDKREYPAKLIGSDEKSDIALLKIEADALPVAKIGNPDLLKAGEWVAAIGAPFGFDNSVTSGIVSAKSRTLPGENYTPFIQTDVAINPGNSGGPLFNLKGQVIGINSQIYSRNGGFMGISFAIPIDVAMNVADQLKTSGKVERGQLGVMIQEVSFDLAKSFGLDKPTGALVSKVLPDSPAAKAGLQVGDIIRSVNGEEVRSSNDLPLTIGALAPGREIKLGILRGGKQITASAVLGTADSKPAQNPVSDQPPAGDTAGSFEAAAAGLAVGIENGSFGSRLVVLNAQGAAARAGIRRGDIIVRIGSDNVADQAGFETAMQKAGKHIPVLIERGGSTLFVALMLP